MRTATRLLTSVAGFANRYPQVVQLIAIALFLGTIGVVVEMAAKLYWFIASG